MNMNLTSGNSYAMGSAVSASSLLQIIFFGNIIGCIPSLLASFCLDQDFRIKLLAKSWAWALSDT